MRVRLADIVPELDSERPRGAGGPAPWTRPGPANPAAPEAQSAAFERGRREGVAAANRDFERERADADARLALAVAEARQSATVELGQAMADRIDAAVRALEERLVACVIDVMEPVLSEKLDVAGRQAFAAAVKRAVAIGPAVKVRLSGPAEILAAISRALEAVGVIHETFVADQVEVTADVDDLRVKFGLGELSAGIEELVG